jgi:hypothetical protein
MPENKSNNGWGIYALRKFVEYAGLALALWQLGIPALDAWYEKKREAYDLKYHKTPFRTLLSEEMEVPVDRLHIYMGEWAKQHEASEDLLDEVFPILESEVNNIRPRLEILPGGRAKWFHIDGEVYDASIGQDGMFWFHLNGVWYPCHT